MEQKYVLSEHIRESAPSRQTVITVRKSDAQYQGKERRANNARGRIVWIKQWSPHLMSWVCKSQCRHERQSHRSFHKMRHVTDTHITQRQANTTNQARPLHSIHEAGWLSLWCNIPQYMDRPENIEGPGAVKLKRTFLLELDWWCKRNVQQRNCLTPLRVRMAK